MTKRTTDQWEALLDGWVYDKQPDKLLGARERFAKVREQEKAAPEAVAEVVRLREELEALRRACIESAEEAERNAEVAYIPDPYVAVEEAERDTADIITRILDGSES